MLQYQDRRLCFASFALVLQAPHFLFTRLSLTYSYHGPSTVADYCLCFADNLSCIYIAQAIVSNRIAVLISYRLPFPMLTLISFTNALWRFPRIFQVHGVTKDARRRCSAMSCWSRCSYTCFYSSEATNGRALKGATYADGNAMTEENCINYCASKSYIYAGVEYSSECCKFLSNTRTIVSYSCLVGGDYWIALKFELYLKSSLNWLIGFLQSVATHSLADQFLLMNLTAIWLAPVTVLKHAAALTGYRFSPMVVLPLRIQFITLVLLVGLGKDAMRTFTLFLFAGSSPNSFFWSMFGSGFTFKPYKSSAALRCTWLKVIQIRWLITGLRFTPLQYYSRSHLIWREAWDM